LDRVEHDAPEQGNEIAKMLQCDRDPRADKQEFSDPGAAPAGSGRR